MNTENHYQETDLGNIAPNPHGEYRQEESYEYLDLVVFEGGSYVCLAENGTTITGISPESGRTTQYWQVITIPGSLTPEYIAMHDRVKNLSEQVEADAEEVRTAEQNVSGMEMNVARMQEQTRQSAEAAERSKDSAAGYAASADASRQAAEESEQNVNAQVSGFDIHVAEKTEESENDIEAARIAANKAIIAQQEQSVNEVSRAGIEAVSTAQSAAQTATEKAQAAATSEKNAAASEKAAKLSEENATKMAEQVAADKEQVANDRTAVENAKKEMTESAAQIEKNAQGISELKGDLADIRTIEVGQNLLDEANANLGYLESNGIVSESSSYKVSDYVELEANTDYCLTSYYKGTPSSAIRKIVMLYDSLRTPITATYQNTKDGTSITFNSETYKYVRVCVEASRKSQLNKGAEKPYEPYIKTVKNGMVIGSETVFENGVINKDAIEEYSVSKTELVNCYDDSKSVIGLLDSLGGIDTTGTNYKTSDFIQIKKGITYTIYPKCRILCLYDYSKNLTYRDASEKISQYSFTAENDGYMRFSIIGDTEPNTISIETSFADNLLIKNQEGIDLSNTQKKTVESIIRGQNILYGKKWVVVGDSFTNGDEAYDDHIEDGKYKGMRALYHYLIGNRNEMDIVHFAEGGRVMTCPSDIQYHNSFSDVNSPNNYTDIPALNPDYITIWLGINDSKTEQGEVPIGTITLGTIDDTTVNTFYGAWNVVLQYLIQNCPYTHIGVVVSNGCTGTNFPDAIRAVCRKWGIAYLDLNGDYSVPLMHRVNGKSEVCDEAYNLRKQAFWVSETNGHPNAHAQAYQSTFIENFLRSI